MGSNSKRKNIRGGGGRGEGGGGEQYASIRHEHKYEHACAQLAQLQITC